ncbi:MAG: hypothetical protein ACHQ4H_10020 [Ktedonobacterales bacterium]
MGAPGSGTPLVLALGADGILYERNWQAATTGADNSMQLPEGWGAWLAVPGQPAGVRLAGALLAVPENAAPHFWIGGWADTPLDLFALDTQGHLWWFRSVSLARSWDAVEVPLGATPTTLIAATAVVPATTTSKSGTKPGAATPATAARIHLYLGSAHGTLLAALDVPAAGLAARTQGPALSTLAAAPGASAAHAAHAIALPVGPDASVLVASSAGNVLLGGTPAGIVTLAPDAATTNAGAATSQQPGAWLALGRVAQGASFDDAFTGRSLDARWNLMGPRVSVALTGQGVALSAPAGSAALLQGTSAETLALSVKVTLPEHPSTALKAGLLLYLDGGDWLALRIDPAGRVALCAAAWGQAGPCFMRSITLPQASRSVTLRLVSDAAGVTGQVSADGTTWQTVGQWLPIAPEGASGQAAGTPAATAAAHSATPSASATPSTTHATVVAPLAFTACGLLVSGSVSAGQAPLFSDFSVSASVPQTTNP